jgi:3-methyl-2-oxobutanoate hydroxymethyltransferase
MVTLQNLAHWKATGQKFAMLTAGDYTLAKLIAAAGVPVILVGDSLGQVMLGYPSTQPVTLEEMIHHTRAVVRGAGAALVVADMPFMSYQVSVEDAVRSAGRLVKEGGAQAVKLEGGADFSDVIRGIVRAGIPVMGHIGLRPQSVVQQGGYRTQGTDAAGRRQLLADGRAVEKAGAFALVIEKTDGAAAGAVTRALRIPVIGCGSGPACDAQVLVTYDVLGLFPDFTPPFVKQYARLGDAAKIAMTAFDLDVRLGKFPGRPRSASAPAGPRKAKRGRAS